MNRPVSLRACSGAAGYTLVEILVATTLSLLLLGAVVQMFGTVGQAITDSRAMLESAERLRLAAVRLQTDLGGVTANLSNPWCRPENNEGYFEYIEGTVDLTAFPINSDNGNAIDTTVGDFDDILMFTTRSTGRPFVGKFGNGTIQSDVAEVAWFVRGRTLHRRVLLVAPGILNQLDGDYNGMLQHVAELGLAANVSLYAQYDVSFRAAQDANGAPLRDPSNNNTYFYIPNTLGDLTRRECRYAHRPTGFPYEARVWYQLGLPTLRECSAATWNIDSLPPLTPQITLAINEPGKTSVDFWANGTSLSTGDALPWADNVLASGGSRVADDVILTHVIGFDVKAWDPIVGGYVDLGATLAGVPYQKKSRLATVGVYDTWPTHYESVGTGILDDLPAGNGSNGFDDLGRFDDPGKMYNDDRSVIPTPADGIVDSADEMLTSPPYPVPLRGIQVKIRVFEPDSRQIREVTVVQGFLRQ